MSQSEEISIETLRVLAERAGLKLTDQELAEVRKVYHPSQVARLRELDLEKYEPAPIFIADWRG